MRKVDFLEKLLDGVEVEWKPLGELGELVRGNGSSSFPMELDLTPA